MILPSATGAIALVFVVHGYQGAGVDPHQLALAMEAVLGEAKARGTGQPVVVFGDFNAAPGVMRAIAKAIAVLWKVLLRMGMQPSSTCQFALGGPAGTGRERRSTLGRGDTLPIGCA